MELAVIVAAEVAVTTFVIEKRKQVFRKWLEGKLTLEELQSLKQKKWFRKIWNPTNEKVSKNKKTN